MKKKIAGKKSLGSKLDTPEKIKSLACKKGVIIHLDMDGTSSEAAIGSPYSYSSKSKTLKIVAPLLGELDKPLLLEIIRKVFTGGGLLWKVEKFETLNSYKEYESGSEYKNILAFFNGILSKEDFLALKMALFIRSEKEKGKNVAGLKKDIFNSLGERGANIANLCTAGYFENEFMPLYNIMPREQFEEYYELAVGKKARALFVHSGMGEHEMQVAFDEMLEKALKYHMADFRVHGLGVQNVATIKTFFSLRQAEPDNRFIVRRIFEKIDFPSIEYITIIAANAEEAATE